jgi:hypothetical protein
MYASGKTVHSCNQTTLGMGEVAITDWILRCSGMFRGDNAP